MIRPLFHLTVLPPKMPAAEALSQEIEALRRYFGGDLCYLNPNQTSPIYIPRLLFGFQKLGYLRRREKEVSLHHFYNPDPFAFPLLRFLKQPVIYTISSGVGQQPPNLKYFSRLAGIIVPDERSLHRLQQWGLTNVFLARAGVDTERFSYTPAPLDGPVKLLCGSAPWTNAQFQSKGIDALLQAAVQNPHLNLIFLWRGVLFDEMMRRVQALNLGGRVQVINRQVNVNDVLARVHATVNLATRPGIVKSYPHSLLDSLAAGKPVVVSRAIPMADYVEKEKCGVVTREVSAETLLEAVKQLIEDYPKRQKAALLVGQRDFSQQEMLTTYEAIYHAVLDQK